MTREVPVFVLYHAQFWPTISPLLPSRDTRVGRIGRIFWVLGGWHCNKKGYCNSKSRGNAKSVGGSNHEKYPMITFRISGGPFGGASSKVHCGASSLGFLLPR